MNREPLFQQLVQRMEPGARLLRTWPLTGGVSAQVTAVAFERPNGYTQKSVVRQHGERDRAGNPQIAADEFRLLQILEAADVAAPRPYLHDAEIFPVPVVVMEFVEGATEFAPTDITNFTAQLARHLAQIHAIDGTSADLSFLPPRGKGFGKRPPQLDESLSEGRIRNVLETLAPPPRCNEAVLLHGDYWPGNVLWRDGQIVAVIDWEDASVGAPLADVGNCRLELLWALGAETMHEFTEQYRAQTSIDFSGLPYWDLCAALRPAGKLSGWGLDAEAETRMRQQHRWFVQRATAAVDD